MSTIYNKMTAIANAIREQTGETGKLSLDAMAEAIGGISGTNFSIVGGTTEPVNPKENTIWVNTDTEITDWIFSTTEPETLQEGMMWFTTGTSSNAEFNVLKNNDIVIYPLSAKQYIGGAWVSKSAKTYKNGAWADWATFIYQVGVGDSSALTGGWGYATTRATSASLTIDANQFKPAVYCDDQTGFIYPYTKNVIDFTKYSKLGIQVETMTNINTFRFGIGSATTNSDTFNAVTHVSTVGTHYCDISSITGTSRIRMRVECLYAKSGNVVISKIWLEE